MPTLKKVILNSNITFDFIHLEEISDENKDIFTDKYIPHLNNSTRALISFDNGNKNCESIISSAFGYSFSVYRQRVGSSKIIPVGKVSQGSLSVMDYNIGNKKTYKYLVYKEDDNYSTDANESLPITTNWWNWSIAGLKRAGDNSYKVDTDNIWIFELNIESADDVLNLSQTTYNNLTRYPRISYGNGNYKTGGLTCLIGNITNNKYVDTADMYDAWTEFCGTPSPKLLKDRKGHTLLVGINASSSKIQDETVEQARTLTFNWTEIGSTDDLMIIE